jgi:AmmeMemoRadiSam system protein B
MRRRLVIGIISPHSCCSVCPRFILANHPNNYDSIIVLGTCHHISLPASLVSASSSVAIPFRNLQVDVALCEGHPAQFSFMSRAADEAENSLEMQYPIIWWVFQDRPIKSVGCLNKESESAIVGRHAIRDLGRLHALEQDLQVDADRELEEAAR